MYLRQQNNLYPQRGQILRRQFLALSRFMLCKPGLLQIEDFTSIKGCEPIKSFKKLFSLNLILWGKGYFAAVGTTMQYLK